MQIKNDIDKKSLNKYIGRHIQVKLSDGKIYMGELVSVDQERLFIKPVKTVNRSGKQKTVTSNWIFGIFLVGIVAVGLIALAACGLGRRNHGFREGFRVGFHDGFCSRCGRRRKRGCKCRNKGHSRV